MSFLFCEHLIVDKPRVLTRDDMGKYFTQDDCLQVVRNKLKSDKFDLLNYELEDLPEHKQVLNEKTRRLRVKVKEPGKSGWTLLVFFVKELPKETDSDHMIGLFTKEADIYNGLLTDLKKHIKGKVYPDCFLAKPNELIVLEDLTLLWYRSRDDYLPYDEEHIEKTLEAVAKLHAASIVFEKRAGIAVCDLMPQGGREVMFVQDQDSPIFEFLCTSIGAIESVAEVYFSHYPKEVTERASKLMMSIPERLKMADQQAEFKVFSHADLWNNNIMFKYAEDGQVESAMLFDFQLAKYTTPAFDVLQAIYLTTETTDNYESLLIHYFNHLSRELAEQDLSIHALTTWTQFKAAADNLRPVMLAAAPLLLHFMLLPRSLVSSCVTSQQARDTLLKQDRSDLVLEAMRTNETYRKRISHSLLHLLQHLKQQTSSQPSSQ